MHRKVSTYLVIALGALAVVGIGLASVSSAQKLFTSAATKFNPIETPAVTATDAKATIAWKSRNKSLSIINYGSTPDQLIIPALKGEETTDHSLTIGNLKSATTYYYRILTDDKPYPAPNEAPLSFTTQTSQNPQPVYPPCLVTVFESYYGAKKGDSRYQASYDLFPVGAPDGEITPQDYLQCLNAQVTPAR